MDVEQTFYSVIDEFKRLCAGRASRKEFWALWLLTIAMVVVSVLMFVLSKWLLVLTVAISSVIWWVLTIPFQALMLRRLHDTDRSGWWLLIGFVPVIGWIVLLIFWAQRGTSGDNRFGSDPLATQSGMSLKEALARAYGLYLTLISGRISRSQHWYYVFIALVLGVVLNFVPMAFGRHIPMLELPAECLLFVPNMLWAFISAPASVAFPLRRLHDAGHSAWFALLFFIPVIGWLILLVLFCTKGTTGPNRFGPDPLAVQA